MKKISIIVSAIFIAIGFTGCETDFENKSKANENIVLSTKAGLIGIAVGMTDHFASSTLAPIVEVPGLSTRELGNLSTFATPDELVLGGEPLTNDNAGIIRLWSRLLKDKGMAESILSNIENVEIEAGTKSGLIAYAKWFKAISLGYLVQNFEQAPIDNAADGAALFSSRSEVLSECIRLLESAKADLSVTPASDEFEDMFPTIDIGNAINAFLARYHLFAGNYSSAITAADLVDLSVKSEWFYDGSNSKNPVWGFAFFDSPDTKPQDNFGLIGAMIPEATDGRIAFYLTSVDETEISFGLHNVDNIAGFYDDAAKFIPVYLPGEMLLIQAEAYAMNDNLPKAVEYINLVREKTDDVFGVNAGLAAWTGDENNKTAILDEIFRNRAIELFMTGLRLEDSRRIHPNLSIPTGGDYSVERNRNYYPYPFDERENNPNTPNDPSI